MRMLAGIAEMNPTNLPDFSTRTPQCHSLSQPGGFKALDNIRVSSIIKKQRDRQSLPEQKIGRIIKTEHVIIIFNIVLIEKLVQLLKLIIERELMRQFHFMKYF